MRGCIGADPVERRCIAGFRDDDERLDEVEAVLELGIRQTPVLAGRDRADLARRELDLDIFHAVAGKQRDPLACRDAHRHQHVGQAIDARVELAEAARRLCVVQRHGLGVDPRALLEKPPDTGACRCRLEAGRADCHRDYLLVGARSVLDARDSRTSLPPDG